MRLMVIESPYAGDVAANVAYAKQCVLDCLYRGEAPYASHLFFTQPSLLDDSSPTERRLGIDAGLAWASAALEVSFYIDRGWSPGMKAAYRHAVGRGAFIHIRALGRAVTAEDRMGGLT